MQKNKTQTVLITSLGMHKASEFRAPRLDYSLLRQITHRALRRTRAFREQKKAQGPADSLGINYEKNIVASFHLTRVDGRLDKSDQDKRVV